MMPVPTVYRSALDQPAFFQSSQKVQRQRHEAPFLTFFMPKKCILDSIRPTDRPYYPILFPLSQYFPENFRLTDRSYVLANRCSKRLKILPVLSIKRMINTDCVNITCSETASVLSVEFQPCIHFKEGKKLITSVKDSTTFTYVF